MTEPPGTATDALPATSTFARPWALDLGLPDFAMFKEILKLLTKTGKRDLIVSSVFFALYGLSSIAMIVIVFSILFQLFNGISIESLYKYFIAIGLLVVFKGVCNIVAEYLSPVVLVNKADKRVTLLHSVALTNSEDLVGAGGGGDDE